MILPYRNETRYWWMATNAKKGQLVNNWNPWCNFNALQCALLLENDAEALADDVYKTMISVDQFINYVKPDGACEEGPSYWGHAAGKLHDYLKILHLGTNGHISLFQEPLIKEMGEYIPDTYVGDDWVVNFADASAQFSADAALIYRYGKAVDSDYMMDFAAELIQGGKNSITYGVDFYRALESLSYDQEIRARQATFKKKSAVIYPLTQFYYFSNKNDFFLATKGGYNNESHNHNDVGTFSLYYKNKPFIIDVGVGTYTRQTFGPERYTIWTMRSPYHNLPSINGQEQLFGSQYKASDVRVDEKSKKLSMDISTAYPDSAQVKKWVRTYQLKKNTLVIEDDFELNKLISKNQIHFMIWGEVDASKPGIVHIKNQEDSLVLEYNSTLFGADLETIVISDPRLTKVWGEKVYRLTLTSTNELVKGKYQYRIYNN